ncbi:MAG: class II aldolase/adducin family protein [Nanoarchaeota archaeon]
MPKLQRILYLPLADYANYSCVLHPVSSDEIKEKLLSISDNVEVFDDQQEGLLFISPAPYEKLKEIKEKIDSFQGKVYIAPNDKELDKVKTLFIESKVILLHSNVHSFQGDHVARLIDTLICEDIRVKFKVELEKDDALWKEASEKYIKTFQQAGKRISQFNNKPLDGSISMRVGNSFMVTASKTNKKNIQEEDLVLITKVNETISYQGKRMPSSETVLHEVIYKRFPSAQVILHPHCKLLTEHFSLDNIRTKEFIPYGTRALAEVIIPILEKSKIGILRHHGEVIIGSSFEEAFKILEETLHKVS